MYKNERDFKKYEIIIFSYWKKKYISFFCLE